MNWRSVAVFGAVLLATTAIPTAALAVASAELYRTESYVYGRFEARIRYAAGDGVVSSFFLWKEGSELANAYWNELDFEKLGANCRMQTNTLYGSNPLMHSEQSHTMPADMCEAYHDYRFDWTPTYIAWSIDGREIRRDTGAVVAAFADNARAGMSIHFNVWPGNANFGGNFDPAILPVRQYISWVQYSSYQNESFTLAWREEFNGNSLPSGWAIGNWASPYELSTHHPDNVSFVNGIAVLSLTPDGATGFSGAPPADASGGASAGNANGGAGAGGSTGGASNNAGSGGAGRGGAGSDQGGSSGVSQGGTPSGGSVSQGGTSNGGGVSQGGATAGSPAVTGGGGAGGSSAGSGTATSPRAEQGGCSCRAANAGQGRAAALAALFALAVLRRRRVTSLS